MWDTWKEKKKDNDSKIVLFCICDVLIKTVNTFESVFKILKHRCGFFKQNNFDSEQAGGDGK